MYNALGEPPGNDTSDFSASLHTLLTAASLMRSRGSVTCENTTAATFSGMPSKDMLRSGGRGAAARARRVSGLFPPRSSSSSLTRPLGRSIPRALARLFAREIRDGAIGARVVALATTADARRAVPTPPRARRTQPRDARRRGSRGQIAREGARAKSIAVSRRLQNLPVITRRARLTTIALRGVARGDVVE